MVSHFTLIFVVSERILNGGDVDGRIAGDSESALLLISTNSDCNNEHSCKMYVSYQTKGVEYEKKQGRDTGLTFEKERNSDR